MNFQGGHLWVLLVFVAISFLQWLVRRLQEQSTITKQKQALERRRTEMLRTGRDPDEEAADKRRVAQSQSPAGADAAARQARLRELRQKQLEEMRRKNQRQPSASQTVEVRVPQRTTGASPARRTPTVGAPPTAGPRPPSRPAPPTRSSPSRPAPAPGRSAPARPAGTAAPPPPRRDRPQPTRQTPPKPAPKPGMRDTTTPQSLAHTPHPSEIAPPPTRARPLVGIDGAMSPEDWRRAIVLSEVLAPPISLRGEP